MTYNNAVVQRLRIFILLILDKIRFKQLPDCRTQNDTIIGA